METLVVTYLLLISVPVAISQSVTDSATLLQCLVREGSNPQNFISAVTYIPTNSSFTAVLRRRIPNLRFDKPTTPKPLAIVTPTTWGHIGSALACACDLPIQVRIRSGGHDFEEPRGRPRRVPRPQVFVSFRGVDVRETLVKQVVNTFRFRGVNVFIDANERTGMKLQNLFRRNIVKTASRNSIGDSFLSDCLVCFIEKQVLETVTNEVVIKRFQHMNERRIHL